MGRPLQAFTTEFQDTGSRSISIDDFRRIANMPKRKRKTASIEKEMEIVRAITTYHKYQNIQLVVPGSNVEKWHRGIRALAKS